MKAKLEFDLEDLDDVMSHLRCVKSLDMALALYKIQDVIRDKCEYDHIEGIKSEIGKVFQEYDINLEDLIR